MASETGSDGMANGGMKDFLIEILARWRGNTWGTRLWIATQGEYVGEDETGNRYYRSKKGSKPGPNGYERRMVVYAGGYAEPTTIPPGWYGWMHYRSNTPPTEQDYTARSWQLPHQPNPHRHRRSLSPGWQPAQQGRAPARHRRLRRVVSRIVPTIVPPMQMARKAVAAVFASLALATPVLAETIANPVAAVLRARQDHRPHHHLRCLCR